MIISILQNKLAVYGISLTAIYRSGIYPEFMMME